MACLALHTWLRHCHAADALAECPESRASASVRQQLQESGLLQHLAAIISGAAVELDAVATLLAAGDSAVFGNGNSSHMAFQSSRGGMALNHARTALRIYSMACSLVAPGAPRLSPGVALTAVPAAARLALATIRVCSMLQLQGADLDVTVKFLVNTAYCFIDDFTTFLQGGVESVCRVSGARELLSSPYSVPCLAINIVVGLLRLDTSQHLNPVLSTPLAASLFDMLGVDKRRLAVLAQTGGAISMAEFSKSYHIYWEVLTYQVKQAKGRAVSQHLMVQLEMGMLLAVLAYQRTVDIPGRFAGAKAGVLPLTLLGNILDGGLHCVPLETAYTGPQVALQVWPAAEGVGPKKKPSRQSGSVQPAVPPVHCVVAPTAAVLAELLPVFTRYCLTGLEALKAGAKGTAAAPAATSAPGAASSTGNAAPRSTSCGSHAAVDTDRWAICACINRLAALLSSVVVPGYTATGALRPPGAASARSNPAPAVPEAACSFVVHAQDAIMPHAVDILRVLEGLLRDAVGVKSAPLVHVAKTMSALCLHTTKHRSALVMLALAAGPGSRVQRQLVSLLCSLLKAASAVSADSGDMQEQLWTAAVSAASALLVGATDTKQLQQQPAEETSVVGSTSPAAASASLPSLFVMGRCCLCKVGQWQAAMGSLKLPAACRSVQEQQRRLALQPWLDGDHLAPVQGWLQAGSNLQQLAAAGYSPQSLLQQLEKVKEALQAFTGTCATMERLGIPGGIPTLFESTCVTFVKELQSTCLALCSFAVPFVCNNPECVNMSGPSERRLVTGPTCKCGGCRVARFCCRPCLRAQWKHHKPVCSALAAAAAAGTGAPGTGDEAH